MLVTIQQARLSFNFTDSQRNGDKYSGKVAYIFAFERSAHSESATECQNSLETDVFVGDNCLLVDLFPVKTATSVCIDSIKCTRGKQVFMCKLHNEYLRLYTSEIRPQGDSISIWKEKLCGCEYQQFEITLGFHAIIAPNGKDLVGIYSTDLSPASNADRLASSGKNTVSLSEKKKTNERFLVTTFFEPHYACLCFPCIDSPEFRIPWEIDFLHESSRQVLSNMSPTNQRAQYFLRDSGICRTQFPPTPPLPCYLLCWVIAPEFEEHRGDITVERSSDIPEVVLFVPKGVRYSAQVPETVLYWVEKTLEMCTQYFDLPLDIPVFQIVLLPEMLIGGMECHGLTMLNLAKDVGVLSTKPSGDKRKKSHEREFYSLVVHEVIHHWVGNTVGMSFALKEGLTQHLEKEFYDKIARGVSSSVHPSTDQKKELPIDSKLKNAIEQRLRSIVSAENSSSAVFKGSVYMNAAKEIDTLADLLGGDRLRRNLVQLVHERMFSFVSLNAALEYMFA